MRLAMGFAPTESESGAAAVAFNRGLFDAVAAFFREAALLHRSMKGRSRPLAGSGPLDDATLREASRQFMHGIFS